MRGVGVLLCALLAVVPHTAAAQEWRRAAEYDVLLSSYDIEPNVIRLKAGEPVRLRFVNNSGMTHDFSAKEFFARADLRKRDAEALAGGRVKVGPHQALTVALVPAPGRYKTRSDNLFRRLMGMHGVIIVE